MIAYMYMRIDEHKFVFKKFGQSFIVTNCGCVQVTPSSIVSPSALGRPPFSPVAANWISMSLVPITKSRMAEIVVKAMREKAYLNVV